MEQFQTKTFKDLIIMTKDVADRFFIAKKIHDDKSDKSLDEFDFEGELSCDHFLLKVQEAYDSLSELEQNLINNEFFYQSYHQWWTTLYSKATFYRYKKEAMQKFLGAFYGS